MGLFDRVILLLQSTVLASLSFGIIFTALGWSEGIAFVNHKASETNGRWFLGVVGGILLIGSVRLLYATVRRKRLAKTVIHDTDLGQIKVTLYAVENLIERLSRQQRHVRDVRSNVQGDKDGITVSLRLWVSPETNIPDLAESLKQEISRGVRNVVGVHIHRLHIDIENITEARRARVE